MTRLVSLEERVISLYLDEQLGRYRIASQLGITPWNVQKVLAANSIVCRPPGSYRIRTFPLREDAFRVLDDSSAYWIGFLMADGGIIGRDEDVLKVSLAIKDRGQLVKLNQFLDGGNRRIGDDGQSCWITFVSKKMTNDLAGWGVTARKSFTACPLQGVDSHPSFWRGLFDGDGNIKSNGAGRLSTAAPAIEAAYIAFLITLGCARPWVYRPSGCTTAEIRSTVEDSRSLLATLYPEDASWYLDRKFLRAQQLLR